MIIHKYFYIVLTYLVREKEKVNYGNEKRLCYKKIGS